MEKMEKVQSRLTAFLTVIVVSLSLMMIAVVVLKVLPASNSSGGGKDENVREDEIPQNNGDSEDIPIMGTPPYAASTNTWTFGDSSLTWSDVIQIPDCNKEDFDGGDWGSPKADCRSYTHEGNTYYYYSWPYVGANAATLCATPWRVPNLEDFINLDKAFWHTGFDFDVDVTNINDNYIGSWGGTSGGFCFIGNSVNYVSSGAYYWSSTAYDSRSAYYLLYSGGDLTVYNSTKYHGFQVRCVR